VTAAPDLLATLGEIPADYRHRPKLAVPGEDLALPDAHLKWYDVRRPEAAIPADVASAARGFLRAQAAAGRLAIGGELGFTVLHLCGESFYFLLVYTWRNVNELWLTGYTSADGAPFQLLPQGTHLEVSCVWELGVVCHERLAWTRYLCSRRDEPAKLGYLSDRCAGPV
jgi:hypothetical protein